MLRHVSLPIVILSLASIGCGTEPVPCTRSCPDISGAYALENATLVGQCAFSPYLLAPTVQVLQSDSGRRVVLGVIDPSSQLEVPLMGEVFLPNPEEHPGELGSFRIDTRTVRAMSEADERMVTLDVSASGSVFLHEGHRVLSATLTTLDATSGKGCTVTLSVTGYGN